MATTSPDAIASEPSAILHKPAPNAAAKRSWLLSLRLHWLAATIALMALIPVVGTDSVWSADVGAQLAQSSRLAAGDGWYFEHPFPEADPTGEWFSYHLAGRAAPADADLAASNSISRSTASSNNASSHTASSETEAARYVVLAKHPLFTWLVAGLLRLGGVAAVMAFSALCTTVAAAGVGALTRLATSDRTGVVSLWITVALSPLAFDGFLGYAHTLAAALAVWAMVAAVSHVRSQSLLHGGVPLACSLCFFGSMVRSESTLAGLALGGALFLAAGSWMTSARRRLARLGGVGLVGATLLGYVVDRAVTIPVTSYIGSDSAGVGWLAGRFQGFGATWLSAGNFGWRPEDVLLAAVPVLWYLSGRQSDPRQAPSQRFAVAGALLLGVWVALNPAQIVPGLLLAFPLLVLLAAVRFRLPWRHPIEPTAALAFGLLALSVILTQHPRGGTSEWGGRYFAVGIPFAVVAVGSGARRLLDTLRRSAAVGLGIPMLASAALVGGGLNGLQNSKQLVVQLESTIETLDAEVDQARPPRQVESSGTVVISTAEPIARLMWQVVPEARWLLVPPDELALAMGNLEDLGVERVVVVASRGEETPRSIGAYGNVDVVEPWSDSSLEVLTFHRP